MKPAEENVNTHCAMCTSFACYSKHPEQSPDNCPMRTELKALGEAEQKYKEPHIREFARAAAMQEFEGYIVSPEGRSPKNTRIEEIAQFAGKMGYKKLGIAFCFGLRREARVFAEILQSRGFEVMSVCCKTGAVPKETIGLGADQQIAGPNHKEAMCNPIAQAEILNVEGSEFNIVVGLCVGHDSLFFKHADAPTTVLIAKDRVLGHNPVAGLYLSKSYYQRLFSKKDS